MVNVKHAEAGQARAVLADGRGGVEQLDLPATVVVLSALNIKAGGRSRAVAVDLHGRTGISTARAVTDFQRRLIGDDVGRITVLGQHFQTASADNRLSGLHSA